MDALYHESSNFKQLLPVLARQNHGIGAGSPVCVFESQDVTNRLRELKLDREPRPRSYNKFDVQLLNVQEPDVA